MPGLGLTDRSLTEGEIRKIVVDAAAAMDLAGQKVLLIIPDSTRTCPLPLVARLFHAAAMERQAAKVDFLIALGTHQAMSEEAIHALLGVPTGGWSKVFGASRVFNHDWQDKAQLRKIGTLTEQDVAEITHGLFKMNVDVSINKLLFDYDRVLIVGPVFPHEVVGFSGGNKYFFPGVCGPELLNFFHWLGAVITNPKIIGTKHTPVRATVDRAAAMLRLDKFALCMVVHHGELSGLFFGTPEEAWSPAADLSARLHVVYVDKPFASILAQAPAMYDDIWTAGKCMYKMEPVVADGGELIIYAPHVTEVSYTHGRVIDQVGYHTRDYFLAQWERFKDMPWGVLAHSTHVRGIGTFEGGRERCRVKVTLATGIPESRCKQICLGYRDPKSINIDDWRGQEAHGRLYVAKAGEMLYKLKNPPAWQTY